jgi:protein-L-isoaspartate(D-aspartate) O-methyltransferase
VAACLSVPHAVPCASGEAAAPPTSETDDARRRMVAEQIQARGVRDPCVLRALSTIPRHLFVPEDVVAEAYDDHAVAIGFGQTISQPYVVAVMTESLRLGGTERVLEVGTGSGYQAAVLVRCAREVFTIEIHPVLARAAAARLQTLGYAAAQVREGDGRLGWPEKAPFDAVIVTAAGPEVPPALVEQLREGGVLVMPRGEPGGRQTLIRGLKRGERLETTELFPVAFVPLIGAEGVQRGPSPGTGGSSSSGKR